MSTDSKIDPVNYYAGAEKIEPNSELEVAPIDPLGDVPIKEFVPEHRGEFESNKDII